MSLAEIRYLQVPATDPAASARFYERALGWGIRTRPDGSTAFDDSTGHVSGELTPEREAAGDTGVLVYVRVESVEAALAAITDAGGETALPVTLEGERLAFATFRDPAGNVLGIFEERGA
jgi:predicted enzyme related to lactoylglutathione lyase